MTRQHILFLSYCVAVITCGGCRFNTTEDKKQSRLQQVIDSVRASLEKDIKADIPSLNILVGTPDKTYFISSVGKGGTAVKPNTNFRFASNTKNFTAAAILNMQQDGWLNINDPVSAVMPGGNIPYLPDSVSWNFPYKNQVTIKLLLQNTAGVYDVDNDSVPGCEGDPYTEYMLKKDSNHQFSFREMANALAQHQLSYQAPGLKFHYSNTGFGMLGEIIARVYSFHAGSKKTYGDYLYDKIYGPSSPVPVNLHFAELAADQQLASPYIKSTILTEKGIEIIDKKNASSHVAEGNGCGSMEALNKYIRTLMKGTNVLNPDAVRLMQLSVGVGENNKYAFGCSKFPNLGYGHSGATEGYLSLMLYDPETDVSVIVMMPFWDLRNGKASFTRPFQAITDAGWTARSVLGYPGKPPSN